MDYGYRLGRVCGFTTALHNLGARNAKIARCVGMHPIATHRHRRQENIGQGSATGINGVTSQPFVP